MARRSNKTAHVLNLLAGHDSQTPTEGTTANETAPSPSEAAPAKEAAQPSAKEDAKPDAAQPTKADAEPVTVSAPVSAQNISVIDTTGTDPVAELIHQELSNQFESKLGAVSPNAAEDNKSEADAQDMEPQITETAEVTETAETLEDTETAEAAEVLEDTETAEAAEVLEDTEAAEASEVLEGAETAEASETLEDTETAKAAPVTTDFTSINSETTETAESVTADSPAEAHTVTVDSEAASQPGPTAASMAETEAVPEPEPDFVYLNVMEEIVKDKIIYFMRQFDLCTCERCKADTIALTMNGLMPKYIVTTPAAVAPLISYYTNRLIPDVTVEAIKACMTVKDNPRH